MGGGPVNPPNGSHDGLGCTVARLPTHDEALSLAAGAVAALEVAEDLALWAEFVALARRASTVAEAAVIARTRSGPQ